MKLFNFRKLTCKIVTCMGVLLSFFIGWALLKSLALNATFCLSEGKETAHFCILDASSYAYAIDLDQRSDKFDLLPVSEQKPETLPHFPNRTAAFIWRNWNLLPIETIAATE